jgi:hypothetical protein
MFGVKALVQFPPFEVLTMADAAISDGNLTTKKHTRVDYFYGGSKT